MNKLLLAVLASLVVAVVTPNIAAADGTKAALKEDVKTQKVTGEELKSDVKAAGDKAVADTKKAAETAKTESAAAREKATDKTNATKEKVRTDTGVK